MARKRKHPTFWEAFRFWAKLGFISFGGPAGQISIMHEELVERKKWATENEFTHGLNYCMLLPGPEAQQLATYIGWRLHGIKGAFSAGMLFILPSYFLFLLLGWIYMAHGNLAPVMGFFNGVKPAVAAIILFAVYRIGRKVIKTSVHFFLALAALLAVGVFKFPFIWVVALGAAIGFFEARKAKKRKVKMPFPLDDHHAVHVLKVIAIFVFVWFISLFVVAAIFGTNDDFVRMATFFTKAALITFGGAYAVLPYVFEQAVSHYGWLTLPQVLDGLALGETTPGPLTMVVAFISFVGGWNNAAEHTFVPLLGGIIGTTVTTYFTFLPSFMFILAGGPFIDHLGKMPAISKALSYVTAAVVGTIAYLGLFVAIHIFVLPVEGIAFNIPAIIVAFLSLLAIIRFRVSIPLLVVVAGVAGLAFQTITF